jgi:signal transduction histidine kinase/CheY-like chemotaxis protein
LYQSYMTSTPAIATSIVVILVVSFVLGFHFYLSVTLRQEKRTHEELVRTEAEREFTSFLAHEVRNPLSGIDSSSQLMLENEKRRMSFFKEKVSKCESLSLPELRRLVRDMEEPIEDCSHILKCVKYIQAILNNTLDLTKLKDGRLNFQMRYVQVRVEVLDTALKMLSSMKAHDVVVEVDCDESLSVYADPLRFTQIIVNLLTNAFKFCKSGVVRVEGYIDESTQIVTIAVKDTGPGIPAEHRHTLFSKYGQIAVRQGTGLGLCLAKELCLAMKGDIYIADDYTNGSCFVIKIPGSSVKINQESYYLVGRLSMESLFKIPKYMNILIVDDSIAASKLLIRRLLMISEDLQPFTALNGEEAIQICEDYQGGFDLIIMDQNMQSTGGVLLGHETVRIMRSQLGMTHTAIFGCTGNEVDCRTLFLAAGADEVWPKPTPSLDDMVQSIFSTRTRFIGRIAALLPCSLKVVVIDDNEESANSFCRRLSGFLPCSWRYSQSSSAESFFDKNENHFDDFAIIITEESFKMGHMLGSEMMRRLRRDYNYQGLLISFSCQQVVEDVMNAGGNFFWLKPAPTNEEILQQLHDYKLVLESMSPNLRHLKSITTKLSERRNPNKQ